MGTRRLKATLEFDVKGENELKQFTGDLKEAGNAGKQATPGINDAAKGTSGLSGSIKGLLAGGALLAAGKQLLAFGQASISAASDVQEMQSKFDAVFKDLGGDVTAELDAFADAANRSVYDLQGFAATLQDTFVPLGFARDEAAKTSIELVKLAEDLASFNNLDTADVVRDLQSAMVGNTETLRKYGVVASQAAIDQEAMALGMDFTKGAMDAQTKAAAILSLTIKGTTDAQGDAIKTADSYANVSKGLEASMTDLKVVIGEQLIPAASELKVTLTGLVAETTDYLSEDLKLRTQLLASSEALEEMGYSGVSLQKALGALGEGTILWRDSMVDAETMALRTSLAIELLEDGFQGSADELGELVRQQELSVMRSREMGEFYAAQAAALEVEKYQEYEQTLRAINRALLDFGGDLGPTTRELEEMAYATGELGDYQSDMINAAKENAAALDEEAKDAQEAAEAHAQLAKQLEAQEAGYFQNALAAQEAGDAQLDLNQAMYDAAANAGASATELAVLGGALGLYSDEAVDAALKTAAINVKVAELAQAYADGEISVGMMRAELLGFISDLENPIEPIVETGSISDATTAVAGMLTEIEKVPLLIESQVALRMGDSKSQLSDLLGLMDQLDGRHVSASVEVNTTNVGDVGGGSQGDKGGSSGAKGNGGTKADHASGTDGWLTVPPGYPNDSYTVGLSSGEPYYVGKAGESAPGGNTVTISNVFNGTAPEMVRQVVDAQEQALQEAGIRGF